MWMQFPQRSEEGAAFPEVGVTVGCEQLNAGSGNQTLASTRAGSSWLLKHLCRHQSLVSEKPPPWFPQWLSEFTLFSAKDNHPESSCYFVPALILMMLVGFHSTGCEIH